MGAMHVQSRLSAQDGVSLFYQMDVPEQPKAIFIFVHGVCEHCGRYQYLTEKFNSFGYGVYRFDLRGHGQSEGARGFVKSYMDYIEDTHLLVTRAHKEYPALPVYMLGHSMGGFITAAYGIQYPDTLSGQILSGTPAIELPLKDVQLLKKLPFELLQRLRVGNKLGAVVSRDPEVVKAYGEDPLNLKKSTLKMSGEMFLKGPKWMAENIKNYRYPCLILHGGEDKIVTPEASKWLFSHIGSEDKELKIYEGLYHEIFNEQERDTVIEDVHTWMEKRLAHA